MTDQPKLVAFHHPLRSSKRWYLGVEEGNSWTAIAILKITPEEFAAVLNKVDKTELKVDISTR